MVEVAELRLTLGSLLTTIVFTGGGLVTTFEVPPLFWLTIPTEVCCVTEAAAAVPEVLSEQEELISVTSMANDT